MQLFKTKSIEGSLRICIVGGHFPILGRSAEEGFLWPLAKGLAERGHEVTILSWRNPQRRPQIKTDRIQAFFLGEQTRSPRRLFPEMALKKFEELHNEQHFDIVHSLDDSGALIGKHRKDFGVAMTYDVAATQMAQIFAILAMGQESLGSLLQTGTAVFYKFMTTYFGGDRRLLRSADGMFVTTPQQSQMLERYYLYPELKTFRVPYGSEYVDLSPREKSEELRKELNIPMNAKNILTVTDMTEMEELTGLLYAFQKLVVKKPSTRLIIVGNGPLWNELEYQTLNLALGSKVIFTGAVSNEVLPDYINLTDAYVNLSSRTSGFEPSMLEAMALGKVVVGSELSSISTVIQDGENGFLIRPADEASLLKILTNVVTENLPVQEIGARARQTVIDIFDREKMADELLGGFRKALENTGRTPKVARITPRHQPYSDSPGRELQN